MEQTYIEYEPGTKRKKYNGDVSLDHKAFKDAGLKLNDDDVVIDIDNIPKEVIKQLIKEFGIKTQIVWTDRGCHLYFRSDIGKRRKSKGYTVFGFEVEYKTAKNSPGGLTIKRNGVLREIENEGKREKLPALLEPIARSGQRKNLLYLEEDRNNSLYAHKLLLLSKGFKNIYSDILSFINYNIFTTPLDKGELETISRYEDVSESDIKEENITANEISEHLRIVKYLKDLYFFDVEINRYVNNDDRLANIIYNFKPNRPSRFYKEVKELLAIKTPNLDDSLQFPIKFENGILFDGAFHEMSFNEFTPYYIDREYKVDAEPVKEVDEFLNFITYGENEYKELLLEAFGYSFITDPALKKTFAKFFILVGGGGNGKGTLINILTEILGRDNCSFGRLHKIHEERTLLSLKGKLVNMDDDVENKAINDEIMKTLKNISTADAIQTRKLYGENETSIVSPNLICTSNHILKSFEKSDSFKRRIVWLPLERKLEFEHEFYNKLFRNEKALDYWTKLIVEAYFRLYKNQKFTTSTRVEKFNQEYHYQNNEIYAFLEDYKKEDLIGMKSSQLYEEYKEWRVDNSENDSKEGFSIVKLSRTVKEVFNLKTEARAVGSKKAKVYVEIK